MFQKQQRLEKLGLLQHWTEEWLASVPDITCSYMHKLDFKTSPKTLLEIGTM